MTKRFKIGELEILALSDGMSRLPPMFYPGLDTSAHPDVLDADGTVHIPTGCFLIRGPGVNMLVDAGLGPRMAPFPENMPAPRARPGGEPLMMSEGGLLPAALADAGCDAADIDTVFLTHLHGDHIGWVGPYDKPYFPNATVVFGAADWDPLISGRPSDNLGRRGLEAAAAADRIKSITGDMVAVAPGVTARHAPGHTAGHYVLIISSGVERAYLLGDVVHCPLQLTDTDIGFLTDVDAGLAARTRETLFRELENEPIAIGMDHFPGLTFQRILTGQGRRWVPVAGDSMKQMT